MNRPDPARRIYWFCRLSGAASRHIDARQVGVPGSQAAVKAADLLTSLYDLRAAHTLACGGVTPDDLQVSGILTVSATLRLRHTNGQCLTCGRRPVNHGGSCEGLNAQDVAAFLDDFGDGGLFPIPNHKAA